MTNTPAGWYPDPQDATRSRWWDGAQWTEHQSAPYVAAVSPADLKAPEGTPWNTVWIWLLVVIPLLPSIGLLFMDWGSMFDLSDPTGMSSYAALFSPAYLLSTLGGFVAYGLCAWFAYLDWRELQRRSVPRPFHFAWVFLSSVVYIIGRSVVVRRRTGAGSAPLWAAIASLVLSFALMVYVIVVMFSAIMAEMSTLPGLGY